MPIVKRKSTVDPKAKPVKRSSVSRSDAHKNLTPLSDLVKKYDRLASDAAWEDNPKEADRLQSIADGYRKRLEEGELYEPNF